MTTPKLFCFDLGDTIMIEETEVKDEEKTTLRAELFPDEGSLVSLKRKRVQTGPCS